MLAILFQSNGCKRVQQWMRKISSNNTLHHNLFYNNQVFLCIAHSYQIWSICLMACKYNAEYYQTRLNIASDTKFKKEWLKVKTAICIIIFKMFKIWQLDWFIHKVTDTIILVWYLFISAYLNCNSGLSQFCFKSGWSNNMEKVKKEPVPRYCKFKSWRRKTIADFLLTQFCTKTKWLMRNTNLTAITTK